MTQCLCSEKSQKSCVLLAVGCRRKGGVLPGLNSVPLEYANVMPHRPCGESVFGNSASADVMDSLQMSLSRVIWPGHKSEDTC